LLASGCRENTQVCIEAGPTEAGRRFFSLDRDFPYATLALSMYPVAAFSRTARRIPAMVL